MNYKTGITVGLTWLAFVTVVFWAGGYNFDQRGETAVVYLIASVLGGFCIGGLSSLKSNS